MKHAAWLALVLSMGAFVSAFTGSAATAHTAEPGVDPGPVLLVRTAPDDGTPAANATSPAGDRATALALAALPAHERRAIVEHVTYASARLEAQLSPLGDDFGDDDALAELNRGLTPYMPALAAARAFDAAAWGSPSLSVRVAASCETAHAAPDETCLSLWDETDGPRQLGGRARFLAWSAAHAAVIDLDDAGAKQRCAEVLRSRVALADSPLALVLGAEDLAVAPNDDRRALEAAALRLGAVMSAGNLSGADSLDAMARPAPSGRAAPWLALSPTQLVIVPRLSAITRLGALADEIEAAAGGAKIRWIHRPQ